MLSKAHLSSIDGECQQFLIGNDQDGIAIQEARGCHADFHGNKFPVRPVVRLAVYKKAGVLLWPCRSRSSPEVKFNAGSRIAACRLAYQLFIEARSAPNIGFDGLVPLNHALFEAQEENCLSRP